MKSSKYKILFVDDEKYQGLEYVGALEDAGFKVTFRQSVEAALKEAQKDKFHVVVLDVRMDPESLGERATASGQTTGIELGRELRDLLPEVKLVALTTSEAPNVHAWFTQDDSYAIFLKKETDPDNFPHLLKLFLIPEEEQPNIFIVHGRDEETLSELKSFIKESLNLDEPIVLSDQPSKGKTIIEKFEHYARNIDIVFVLMTPDDYGHLLNSPNNGKLRPRLNVVLEFGIFLGSLSRRSGKIILLKKGNIELPSDISGVVYIDIGSGIKAAETQIKKEINL